MVFLSFLWEVGEKFVADDEFGFKQFFNEATLGHLYFA